MGQTAERGLKTCHGRRSRQYPQLQLGVFSDRL